MKKLLLVSAALSVALFANEGEEFEGLLTTPGCAAQGAFADCYLENYACGSDGCFRKTEAGLSQKMQSMPFFNTAQEKCIPLIPVN